MASTARLNGAAHHDAVDLSDADLAALSDKFEHMPAGAIIEPGKFQVVARDAFVFSSTYGSSIAVLGEFTGKLDNNGETLKLIIKNSVMFILEISSKMTRSAGNTWPPRQKESISTILNIALPMRRCGC